VGQAFSPGNLLAGLQTLHWYWAARIAGAVRLAGAGPAALPERPSDTGVSVVIPSRNGRPLLEAQLPGIVRELAPFASEILIVDNGSQDGTAEWLRAAWPQTRVEVSPEPLSFARAVNRGIARAGYSRVCLLNNDMLLDPGFFAALLRAFHEVPELFCATAQIRFPEGVRREETGKAVMAAQDNDNLEDFPIRCDEPLAGEDGSYVLYGSGGASLYDAAKLRALGGADEAYARAYVEDLDLGYRAWKCGWPTVYVAGALVEHRHRATTSRYYSAEDLDEILEVNYLRFLAKTVTDPRLFRRLWRRAALRLRRRAHREAPARRALGAAAEIALAGASRLVCPAGAIPAPPGLPAEEAILALTNGSTAVFPGRPPSGKPRVLVAGAYLPSPQGPGDAAAMYRLMDRAAADFDQVLVAFSGSWTPPPPEVLRICAEVVLVRRSAGQALAFRAALRQTVRKWRIEAAQLEPTLMDPYAADCAPAPAFAAQWQPGSPGTAWDLQARRQAALYRAAVRR